MDEAMNYGSDAGLPLGVANIFPCVENRGSGVMGLLTTSAFERPHPFGRGPL